jgi:toxin ParE1/3/4
LKIQWHAQASHDLLDAIRYVAEDNLDAALRLRDTIREQIELLAELPEMGRPGRVRGTRELVIAGTRYVVAYSVTRDRVTIYRILHGARQWPRSFTG